MAALTDPGKDEQDQAKAKAKRMAAWKKPTTKAARKKACEARLKEYRGEA